jgi:hypothetical protein
LADRATESQYWRVRSHESNAYGNMQAVLLKFSQSHQLIFRTGPLRLRKPNETAPAIKASWTLVSVPQNS